LTLPIANTGAKLGLNRDGYAIPMRLVFFDVGCRQPLISAGRTRSPRWSDRRAGRPEEECLASASMRRRAAICRRAMPCQGAAAQRLEVLVGEGGRP
jgi:hypothetical protein